MQGNLRSLACSTSRVPSRVEYRPSRRGLFLAAPTKPARAVRKVKRPSPPNAQMNLQAWT